MQIEQAVGPIQRTLEDIQMTLKRQAMRTYNCTAARGNDRLCPLDGVQVAYFPATMEALGTLPMDQCQDVIPVILESLSRTAVANEAAFVSPKTYFYNKNSNSSNTTVVRK